MARRARGAALLIALLAVGLSATAQEGGRNRRSGAPAPDDADSVALERGARERGTLAGEFNAHLADVQKHLKLEAAQQAAWDTFARHVEALMQDQLRGIGEPPEGQDALHQINRRVDVVRNRLAAMEDIADAAGHLYSLLSADQRKVADELLPTAVPSLYSGLPDFSRGSPGQSMMRKKGP